MNETALKERLSVIAKEKEITFNECWKQLILERFLARIAESKHKNKLIFKGGFLLSYALQTERETMDLDFLLTRTKAQVDSIQKMLEAVAAVDLGDGFKFSWSRLQELSQPHMEYTGYRIHFSVAFGKMRDAVQIDLGIGDEVLPEERELKLFSYKGKAIFEETISLMVYPLESVFSEKLHALVSHGKANSRMKDYHDLWIMSRDKNVKSRALKKAVKETFGQRDIEFSAPIVFTDDDLAELQRSWRSYRSKQKSEGLPAGVEDVIKAINSFLKEMNF